MTRHAAARFRKNSKPGGMYASPNDLQTTASTRLPIDDPDSPRSAISRDDGGYQAMDLDNNQVDQGPDGFVIPMSDQSTQAGPGLEQTSQECQTEVMQCD